MEKPNHTGSRRIPVLNAAYRQHSLLHFIYQQVCPTCFVHRAFLVGIVTVVCSIAGMAQTNVRILIDQVYFDKVGSFVTERKVEPVYQLFYDSAGQRKNLMPNACLTFEAADGKEVYQPLEAIGKATTVTAYNIPVADKQGSLVLTMAAFENDKGEDCVADKGDDHLSEGKRTIDLSKFKPGVVSDTMWMRTANEKFGLQIRILYSLGKPADLKLAAGSSEILASDAMAMSSALLSPNYEGISYRWEWKLPNESDWKFIKNATAPQLQVKPDVEVLGFKPAKKTTIDVRMIATAGEVSSAPVQTQLIIVPPAPVLNKKGMRITSSCPADSTGTLHLENISGYTGSYRLLIRAGASNTGACGAGGYAGCNDVLKSMLVKNGNADLKGLSAGEYTLLLGNAEVDDAATYTHLNISVPEIPKLEVHAVTVANVSCALTPNGSIELAAQGGHPSNLTWLMTPQAGVMENLDRGIRIAQLPMGLYTVIAKDACGQLASTKAIDILNDSVVFVPSVKMEGGTIQVDCLDEAKIFDCKLYKADGVMIKSGTTVGGKLQFDGLTPGQYTIEVQEAATVTCLKWKGDVQLE